MNTKVDGPGDSPNQTDKIRDDVRAPPDTRESVANNYRLEPVANNHRTCDVELRSIDRIDGP
jgi:hypothetical protein